jgi:hypothetical protein
VAGGGDARVVSLSHTAAKATEEGTSIGSIQAAATGRE